MLCSKLLLICAWLKPSMVQPVILEVCFSINAFTRTVKSDGELFWSRKRPTTKITSQSSRPILSVVSAWNIQLSLKMPKCHRSVEGGFVIFLKVKNPRRFILVILKLNSTTTYWIHLFEAMHCTRLLWRVEKLKIKNRHNLHLLRSLKLIAKIDIYINMYLHEICKSIQVVITKYHWIAFKQRKFISHNFGGWKFEIMVPGQRRALF